MTIRGLTFVTMIAAATLLPLSACSPIDPLAGTTWTMELEGDEAYSELASATGITITFADDGTFTGTYTYSKFAGEYSVESDALTFTGPCYTSMACQAAEGIDAQQQFLFALEAVERFSIDGDTLTFYSSDGEMAFERT
ncbi:META domain-containing protein [Chloroflexota bacterium]